MTHRKIIEQMLEALRGSAGPEEINNAREAASEYLAAPEVEVAILTEKQRRYILDLALDLEKTGRIVSLSEGQERSDMVARNRKIQCALEDYLRNLTHPAPEAKQPAELTDEELLSAINSMGVEGEGRISLSYKTAESNTLKPTHVAVKFARAVLATKERKTVFWCSAYKEKK